MTVEDTLEPLQALLSLYLADGHCCSEYDVLRWLQEPQQGLFSPSALQETQSMFQAHFLLMHCLYTLRQQWANERSALLDISALHIQKHPLAGAQPTTGSPASTTHWRRIIWICSICKRLMTTSNSYCVTSGNACCNRRMRPQTWPRWNYSRPRMPGKFVYNTKNWPCAIIPDRGGQPERFRDIQSAYQRLRQRYL